MNLEAIIDRDNRVLVSKDIYTNIMEVRPTGPENNHGLLIGNMTQVFVHRNNLYNLICLNTDGGIEIVNRRFISGVKVTLPDYIGRVIYITKWNGPRRINMLSLVDENRRLYHIPIDYIIASVNGDYIVNTTHNNDIVITMMTYQGNLYYIDGMNYLNRVVASLNDTTIITNVRRSRDQISPLPERLRHGYMIDEENNIFEVNEDVTYKKVFQYDRTIIDICPDDTNGLVSIIGEDGTINSYSSYNQEIGLDMEYLISGRTNTPVAEKFITIENDICTLYSTGEIFNSDGRLIDKLADLYIKDELQPLR